jgi:hypothetical protein
MKQSTPKEQNEYAKNVKGEPIYILEAENIGYVKKVR